MLVNIKHRHYAVRHWVKNFNDGKGRLEDEPRSGRPCEAVTQNNLSENSNKNIQELANETGISVGNVCTVLHKELELHNNNVTAKRISHVLMLTEENKIKRMEISRQFLSIFDKGFHNIISGDETRINFFTVSNKNQNKV